MQLMILLMCMYPSSAVDIVNDPQLSSKVESVCSEEPLSMTCLSSQSHILRWTVTLPEGSGTYSRDVSTIGSIPALPIEIAGRTITVHFSRQSTNPLTSTLSIDNTFTPLNGTRINCSTANASEMAIVRVIDVHHASPEVRKSSSFQTSNVTVLLEWTQESFASYNVSIDPQITITMIESYDNLSAQLIVSYNILYNVSVTAFLCGQNVTTDIQLFYTATCGYPLQQLQPPSNISNSVISVGPKLPITQGASINFSCPSAYVLNGPNSTICTNNGEWDPDPQGVNCVKVCSLPSPPPNGYIGFYIRTSEGYTWLKFVCQNDTSSVQPTISLCSVDGRWSPDPEIFCSKKTVPRSQNLQVAITSLIVVLTSSVLFLIVCGICGYYNLKQKRTIQNLSSHMENYNPSSHSVTPTFGIQDTTRSSYQDQDLELTENVAYDTYTHRAL